jgi:hypothetical protein
MLIYLDIETVPSQAPGAREAVRAGLKPPATLKKPESIAAWWANEADAAADEAYRRQALDGGLQGEIISVAICDDSGREWVHCRLPGEDEADLLAGVFYTVEEWTHDDARAMLPGRAEVFPVDDHQLVAHNAAFDVPMLWRRTTVLGLTRPSWLPGPMARAGRDYTCTMAMWAGYGGRVSLDALCRALDIESPKAEGMDGSQVFDAWLDGRVEEIERYNLADVKATRHAFRRLVGVPGGLAKYPSALRHA